MRAPFPKGRFWSRVIRRAARARVIGALQPIETQCTEATDRGLRFTIRVALNLARKATWNGDGSDAGVGTNPFLPYDPDLFVCDVSETHLCLLNKFNVVDHHLLIVTRHFEHQENMLTFSDFEALWDCMSEVDGLGFFNSGPSSGASQPHRHLQLIPLPMRESSEPYPFAPQFRATTIGSVSELPTLPFRHAVAAIPHAEGTGPRELAELTYALYGLLLDAVGFAPIVLDQAVHASGPYNLLLTRDWIMLVPRSREGVDSISINALAFVGSLFVKSPRDLQILLDRGPASVLAEVAYPRQSGG